MTSDDQKRVAQTIAMLVSVVIDPTNDKRSEIALQAAGWALCTFGECSEGEELGDVCERLIARHNRMVSS
jgi:hypothetical protein